MVESRSRLFKYNKAPGPETFQSELIKTMSTEQLKVLQRWFNEILVTEETLTKVTEQEMTGKQAILHKGGPLANLTFNTVILAQAYDGF